MRITSRTALRGAFGAWCAVAASVAAGCDSERDGLDERSGHIVYGSDDRLEYFEVASPAARDRMASSVVALVPNAAIDLREGLIARDVSSWGESAGICPGEPFADQPAAAFCTGVLVDWDLILTGGHCVRAFAPQDFSVVFDYYYAAPGALAVHAGDVYDVAQIVAEALDPPEKSPRLDFAWLRLGRRARPPREPTPLRLSPPQVGDPIVAMSAGGGVPLKLDGGGTVRDVRDGTLDYFVADTDTSHGSSGGGAFDAQLALVGILARGGPDFVEGDGACRATVRESDARLAQEDFTFVHRAIEALCATAPDASSICRADCGEPCQALTFPSGGCAIAASEPIPWAPSWSFCGCLAIAIFRRRRNRSSARHHHSPAVAKSAKS